MTDVYRKIYQAQLSTTAAVTAYTVPAATSSIVKSIRVVNTTATAATFKMWQGGTADANVILPATSIDAGGFGEFEGVLTMAAADTLSVQAGTASALTVTIHGLEIT